MTTNFRSASILTIAALVAGFSWMRLAPAAAQAVDVQAQHDHAAAPPDQTSGPLMTMRPDMMARMKQSDGRIQRLVTAMNQATGEAKIAAMESLVTALANERTAMRDDMMQSMEAAMTACPMMPAAPGTH